MTTQVETLGFGAGILFGFPAGGQTGTNITPVEIGTVQNAKVDITADLKELFGLYSFAIDSAVGKRSVKGSAAFAQFEGLTWNSLLFGTGGSSAAGCAQAASYREAHTIPSSGPYTITITPPSSGTFVQDGGVRFASNNQPLVAVASGVAAGEYTISSGVYTFAAADEGRSVIITYTYDLTTDGQTITFGNMAMGTGPIVSLYLYMPYQAPSFAQLDRGLYFPNVRFGSLSLATKLDDYTEENTSFMAYANPTTNTVVQAFLPW